MPPIVVPPPEGAATSEKQDVGNSSLASVDGKLPALVGGRVPVILPAGGGGLTDAELRATPVPVSGTFWQNTQPVSGTFWQATQPVSGTFWQATQPVSGPLTDAQLRAASVPVQVKDSNRVRCVFTFQGTSSVAEALLTLSKNLGGTVTSGTSLGATAAKRLRITSIAYTLKAGAAAAAFATLHIRSLSNGATLIGSPSILRAEVGLTAATSGSCSTFTAEVPDGLEFSGAETFGATLACQATTNVHSLTLFGYEYTP